MRSLLLAFAFAATCAFGQDKPAESSTAAESDEFLHVQSGWRFPDHVGAFSRKRVNRFNPTGSDMSVGYRLQSTDGSNYVTVFIYPAATRWRPGEDEDRVYDALEKSMICRQEQEFREHELLQFHAESSLGPRKTVDVVQNGSTQHGSKLTFAAISKPGGTPNMTKEQFDLFCFATELWTISYRFTYTDYTGADDDIAQFMRDLKWPQ